MVIETVTSHLPLWLMITAPLTLILGILLLDLIGHKNRKGAIKLGLVLLTYLLVMCFLAGSEMRDVNRAQNTPFKTELVGVYDRVEYGNRLTVICLTDGRIYILRDRYQVPFQKGAKIEILKNEGLIKIIEKK